MTSSAPVAVPSRRSDRAVANWLLLGVAMLVIQVLLGGITRLTGSGLSITEWKPILGAVPPLNETDWNTAFEKYKGIAQYQYLNSGFTLSDFKAIYFWEWMHREWARLMGIVFLVGFVWFLARGRFRKDMVGSFVILFLLGALQGAIGWIMVASGLNDTDLYVSHIRLALHFIAALVLVAYTFWFALKLRIPARDFTRSKDQELLKLPERVNQRVRNDKLRKGAVAIMALLSLQLTYGAFMAGLKAAQAAATWPGINGAFYPGPFGNYQGKALQGIRAWTDNPFAVHFVHRSLATVLVILITVWTVQAARFARVNRGTAISRWWHIPVLLAGLQALLGIVTVLTSPQARQNGFGLFEILAEAHQLVAMSLLLSLLAVVFALSGSERQAGVRA